MKSLKKLTAIVLAMLMVMTMGVFSSSAATCALDADGNSTCADAATQESDGLCDECGLPKTSEDADADVCECDEFVDVETPADGVCDVCGEDMPEEESDPFDFLNSIVEAIEGFIQQIIDFIEGLVATMRGFGDA